MPCLTLVDEKGPRRNIDNVIFLSTFTVYLLDLALVAGISTRAATTGLL